VGAENPVRRSRASVRLPEEGYQHQVDRDCRSTLSTKRVHTLSTYVIKPISLTIDRREDPEQELELTGHDALAGTGGSSMFDGQLYGTNQVRSDLDRKGV